LVYFLCAPRAGSELHSHFEQCFGARIRFPHEVQKFYEICYTVAMTGVLKEALEEIKTLSEADQDIIGRGLLSQVEKLRKLRIEIDKGFTSGEAQEFDIESFIQEKLQHGGR